MAVWLLYIVILLAGGAVGWVIGKARNSDTRVRELEEHLKSLQMKYDHYQDAVTQHFATTAQMTNNLTNAYREVHEHLVRGAQTLCADSKRHGASNPAHAFLSLEAPRDQYSRQNPALLNDASFLASVEPPRDYATKKPDDKGTLDEDFGFK